jgi:hypothetical protein
MSVGKTPFGIATFGKTPFGIATFGKTHFGVATFGKHDGWYSDVWYTLLGSLFLFRFG